MAAALSLLAAATNLAAAMQQPLAAFTAICGSMTWEELVVSLRTETRETALLWIERQWLGSWGIWLGFLRDASLFGNSANIQPRTRWWEYKCNLAWERLRINQEDVEEVEGEEDICIAD